MAKQESGSTGYGFGTFQGVFTPSILTIIGVVMYLRFGWMLGNVGLAAALFIVAIGNAITFLTGLSISALATNMRLKGGGAYFILSRTLGVEAGAFPQAASASSSTAASRMDAIRFMVVSPFFAPARRHRRPAKKFVSSAAHSFARTPP